MGKTKKRTCDWAKAYGGNDFLSWAILLAGLWCGGCQTPTVELDFEPVKSQSIDFFRKMPKELWTPVQKNGIANYHFLLAEYLSLYNQHTDAARNYDTAYNIQPSALLAQKVIANEIKSKPQHVVFMRLRREVLKFPKSYELHLQAGKFYASWRQFSKAIEAYESALDVNPFVEDAYLRLIQIHLEGDLGSAAEIAARMRKSLPDSVLALKLSAKIEMSRSNLSTAAHFAQEAYGREPRDFESALMHAFVLEQEGKKARATQVILDAYRGSINPEDTIAQTAMVYQLFGNLKFLQTKLEEIFWSTSSQNHQIGIQLMLIYWEDQNNDAADLVLKTIGKEDPGSAQIAFLSGLSKQKIGDNLGAVREYSRVVKESNLYIRAQQQIAAIHESLGNRVVALETLLKLLQYRWMTWDAYLEPARLFSLLNRFEDSATLLDQGYKHFPTKHKLLFYRGVYEARAGREDDAIATMQQVIAREPLSEAYNYIGYMYAERGENLDEAEVYIRTALLIKPQDPFYLDSLGWVLYKKGQLSLALSFLLEAFKGAHSEGVIAEHVGDVYRDLEQTAEAASFYERALQLFEDEKDIERVENKLGELR